MVHLLPLHRHKGNQKVQRLSLETLNLQQQTRNQKPTLQIIRPSNHLLHDHPLTQQTRPLHQSLRHDRQNAGRISKKITTHPIHPIHSQQLLHRSQPPQNLYPQPLRKILTHHPQGTNQSNH
jgi:hypothetical protein